MSDKHSRRDFLMMAGSLITMGVLVPGTLAHIGQARLKSSLGGVKGGNVLVVVQLTGGNDGLNMVVPYKSERYYALRPSLALPESDVLPILENLALHPALAGLKGLWDSKQLALVNGVGYPSPDRSHFRSMEIWHTADPQAQQQLGWLGRFLDSNRDNSNNPVMAVHFGRSRSAALTGAHTAVPTFASLADIQGIVRSADEERVLRTLQQGEDGSSALHSQRAMESALDAVDALQSKLGEYETKLTYADDEFSQGMKQIAHLMAVSPETSVFYFSVAGFDTHAQQAERHAELLGGLGSALSVFMQELAMLGKAESTSVLVFSEFGRRVAENASRGTDHGAAGPVLMVSGSIRPGLYGNYPSLEDLEDGDLRYNVDFRQIYAAILEQWFNADAEALLKASVEPLQLFK